MRGERWSKAAEQSEPVEPDNVWVTSLVWPSTAPKLSDGWLTLRGWTARDADAVLAACQDADTRRWMDVSVPYLPEHAAHFVGEHSRQQ
jgi:hypothetical protein